MNLLIIRLSSMGDVILVSSVLSWINQHYPYIKLYLITSKSYQPLFKDDPRINEIFAIEKGAEHTLKARSENLKWDCIVDLQNSRRSKWICRQYFPRVPRSAFDKMHPARMLLILTRINIYKKRRTVAARYIEAAEKASALIKKDTATARCENALGSGAGLSNRISGYNGIEQTKLFKENSSSEESMINGGKSNIPDLKLFFEFAPHKMLNIVEQSDRPFLALFPFAAWRNKQWPLENYAAVGRYYTDKGWKIILFGGKEERKCSTILCEQIGTHCIDLTGRTTLYEAGWMLGKVSLCLGGDTGLSHLARACSVPGGVIFGATTHHLGFFPYGRTPYIVFQTNLSCRPCHAHGGNFCWRGAKRSCLNAISVKRVIEGLNSLLKVDFKERKNNSFGTETNIKSDQTS